MGFITVEDHAGTLECVLFADYIRECQGIPDEDRVVLVKGRLDRREPEGEPKIVATKVVDFEASRSDLEYTLHLKVPLDGSKKAGSPRSETFSNDTRGGEKSYYTWIPNRGDVCA